MRIGITYDLKVDRVGEEPDGPFPDDLQEEFDSPETIESIAMALRDLGHEVEMLGDGRELLERLLDATPDFVFTLAAGRGISRSREARVPAVLDMLGIPYTGSDPLTLAVTLAKVCAKRLVQATGVAVPRGFIVEDGKHEDRTRRHEDTETETGTATAAVSDSSPCLRVSVSPCLIPFDPQCAILNPQLRFPLIVKPAWEGSSKGIRHNCLVTRAEELDSAIAALQQDHRQPVLVEEFIDGDELTVGVIGNDPPQVLGIMRVLPRQPTTRFIYSLEIKRDFLRQVRDECPAHILPPTLEAVTHAASSVYPLPPS